MHRKFIATIIAAAVAITGLSAVPARADQDDVAKALAALAGIAIIAKIVRDNKKEEHVVTRRYPTYPDPVYRPVHPRKVYPRPLPHRVDRKLLPKHCFRSYQTRQGRYHMFGRHCLRNNYRFANSLPHRCSLRIRTYEGIRRGFDARCLRREGYSLARG